MNEKLQRIYYIIGIIQRIGMILLTVAVIGSVVWAIGAYLHDILL